jgi:hypothetical protein
MMQFASIAGHAVLDRKNGPAARSFAADAHDCIMVKTSTNLPNTPDTGLDPDADRAQPERPEDIETVGV